MEYRKLRKSKIVFIDRKGREIPVEEINEFLEKTTDSTELWFFRGCKHTLEKHYTEAIKNFQLSDTKDSLLMIVLSAFKLVDNFLMKEYTEELKKHKGNYKIFNKYGFYPALKVENKTYRIKEEEIEELLSSILNR